MNRRELFAALAATAVAGEALAFAQSSPGTTPPAAPPAAEPVMGSKVWDWNAMVAKPNATGSVYYVNAQGTATVNNAQANAFCYNNDGDYLPKESRLSLAEE